MSALPPFNRDKAVSDLLALARIPGALKIITATPSPDFSRLAHGDPHRRVLHDVVRIEEGDPRLPPGWFTAFSAEGDECSGEPLSLLNRLSEYATWMTPIPKAGDISLNVGLMAVRGQ